MTLTITEVERFLGEHGPVDIVMSEGGGFEELHIRHLDDDTVVLAYEDENGDTQTEEFELLKASYQGLRPKDTDRREFDDDLQDAVEAAWYAITSQQQKGVVTNG